MTLEQQELSDAFDKAFEAAFGTAAEQFESEDSKEFVRVQQEERIAQGRTEEADSDELEADRLADAILATDKESDSV